MNPMLFFVTLSALLVVVKAVPIMSGEPAIREYEDWRHESNDEMIEALKKFGHISSPEVEAVMRSIDRRRFIERPIMNNPYWDIPQSLGFGSVMSSPKVHAQALEILKDHLKPGARVLDIGSGSGYLTACMAHMVGPSGKVYAVEHIEDLVEQANNSMHTYYPTLMDRVHLIAGDGREGHKEGAPYDVIYVGGAVHHYPVQMLNQTIEGGTVLFATGKNLNSLTIHAVDDKKKPIVTRKHFGLSSLQALSSRHEQKQHAEKTNLTEEIEREERDLIFTRETTTLTTIVEYYDDETGTTWNPFRKFPLPEEFDYDWLKNYTDATETENPMFDETEHYETLNVSYDYHKVFGYPDNKSEEITVPTWQSHELSDWNPSNETVLELHKVSKLMEQLTFGTEYYEFEGVKYSPPQFHFPTIDMNDFTTPEWYARFQREVVANFTLPTMMTSKKWRWIVARDKERARLSSLGLLTPWPTTPVFTGDPFVDSLDYSYWENKPAIPSKELKNYVRNRNANDTWL